MDSGNSGSISSSGDEEYDSRSDHHNQPIPSFPMNPSSLITTTHFGSNSNPNNNPPAHLLSHHNNNIFDHHNNNSFFLNLDTARSALMRSDHHHPSHQQPPYSHLGASASSLQIHHSLLQSSHNQFPAQSQSQIPNETVMTTSTSTTTTPSTAAAGGSSGQPAPARASKKRTRASRRAPTTVLTTDTSNFRAMVQEFTGIPAPPFSANSPFSRRFDLFGRSALEGPLYPHLVRPSAIKPQLNIATSTLPASYGQPSDHQQALMRMNMANVMQQNQSLNMGFQLQSLPSLHPDAASGPAQTNLGLDQQHLSFGTASNRVSSDGASQMNNVWRAEGAGSGDVGCKMNFTAAVGTNTPEFHGEKGGLEINVVSSRVTDGTVDSWIFPSD